MEREQDRWCRIFRWMVENARDCNMRQTHRDSLIAGTLLWAALHERPVSWACLKANWPGSVRPKSLPSQSCMSRRLRTVPVLALLERTYNALREQLPCGMLKFIDAKPLPVGGCSKDTDALYGRAA